MGYFKGIKFYNFFVIKYSNYIFRNKEFINILFIVYIKCDEMFCLCLVIFKLYKFFYTNIFILVVYVLY